MLRAFVACYVFQNVKHVSAASLISRAHIVVKIPDLLGFIGGKILKISLKRCLLIKITLGS